MNIEQINKAFPKLDTLFAMRLASFIQGCQKIVDAHHTESYPAGSFSPEFIESAKSYLQVNSKSRRFIGIFERDKPTPDYSRGKIFAFVDSTNGDVLMPAGWKAPAKNGARGNIFDAANGLTNISWLGVAYKAQAKSI